MDSCLFRPPWFTDHFSSFTTASPTGKRGDNKILELSKPCKLQSGTGWLINPCILHAPGSLCTYEPQWGSDVFGMYQNLVEGRETPWTLLIKDIPEEKHQDIDFIIEQLDREKNLDPNFKDNRYLGPVTVSKGDGFHDRRIVYGKVDDFKYFTARQIDRRTTEQGHHHRPWRLIRHRDTGGWAGQETPTRPPQTFTF